MNHAFDISRQGYVNLLLPQDRHSSEPGDSADMVAARTRFLSAGHYESLAKHLVQTVRRREGPLVDLGCGDGHFTALMSSATSPTYGIDISKAAIKAASKKAKDTILVVASTKRLPLADQSFGIATAVMAPFGADASRVVRSGGLLIRVSPGPDHLKELKQVLYADLRPHQRATLELREFDLTGTTRITALHEELSRECVSDLVAMTPLQYRSSAHRQADLKSLGHVSVTSDFLIDSFERL